MYRARLQRIRHRQDERLLRRLFLLLIAIIILIIGFFTWGIPFLISLTELISSFGRADEIVQQPGDEPFFPPRLDAVPTATNAANITLRGFGEEKTTATLSHQSAEKTETYEQFIGEGGAFLFQDLPLQSGENTFSVTLTRADKTTSPPSQTYTTVFDQNPPSLILSEPTGEPRQGPDKREVRVLGATEEGASITVNDTWTVVNPDGGFEATLTLAEGENVITVVATDLAGNAVSAVRRVQYTAGE